VLHRARRHQGNELLVSRSAHGGSYEAKRLQFRAPANPHSRHQSSRPSTSKPVRGFNREAAEIQTFSSTFERTPARIHRARNETDSRVAPAAVDLAPAFGSVRPPPGPRRKHRSPSEIISTANGGLTCSLPTASQRGAHPVSTLGGVSAVVVLAIERS
jgi:hypothetical protein